MSEPPRALPEVEPHRLVPVELMAAGLFFVAVGVYYMGSDLLASRDVQSNSFILGLFVTGFGVAVSVIGYSLRAWYGRRDEMGDALAKAK